MSYMPYVVQKKLDVLLYVLYAFVVQKKLDVLLLYPARISYHFLIYSKYENNAYLFPGADNHPAQRATRKAENAANAVHYGQKW